MNRQTNLYRYFAGLVMCLGLLMPAVSSAQVNPLGQIPQIPAFLPLYTDVPAAERMPIDGEWMVNTIRKRIRIEAGRAYAVDSWLHMLVLKIEPMMAVQKDIRRTGPGQYAGYDLPLVGQFTAQLQQDGTLKVSVSGILGPANYVLVPVRVDDQYAFNQEKTGQYNPGQAAQPVYQQQPQQQPVYQQQPQQQPVYQQQPQQQPVYQQQPQGQPVYQQQPQGQPVYQQQPQGQPVHQQPVQQQQQYQNPQGQVQPNSSNLQAASGVNSGLRSSNVGALNDSFGPPEIACGKDGGEPCGEETTIDAIRVGEAENWGCKGKNLYFTPKNGGQCWSCPEGYRRTAKPIHQADSCKERGIGLGKDTVSATLVRSAYGCPAGQFESRGDCFRCPEGSSAKGFLGANPGRHCKTTFYCDDGLQLMPAPPKVLSDNVGAPYNRVCGNDFSTKDEVIALAREKIQADSSFATAGARLIADVVANSELRNAIKNKNMQKFKSILNSMVSFQTFKSQAIAKGYRSISLGSAPEVKVGWGASQEVGLAMDWNGNIKTYTTTVLSKGFSLAAGVTGSLGVWKKGVGSTGNIGGYARGASVNVPLGVGDVGAGAWFGYYPLDFEGLTFTAGLGVGVDTVNYNDSATNLY